MSWVGLFSEMGKAAVAPIQVLIPIGAIVVACVFVLLVIQAILGRHDLDRRSIQPH